MATNRNTFTTAGLKLTAQVQAGQTKIMFTRAVGSEIDLHAKTDDELSILLAKDIPVNQETQISGAKVVDDTTVQVEAVFDQSKTAKAFTLNTLGLFAKPVDDKTPGEEILYSIVTFEAGQYVYPDNAGSSQAYWISSTIGDTDKLEIILPEDGTSGLGQAALDKLEDRIKDNFATKAELGNPVRSATINGAGKVLPDQDGNINLAISAPDLNAYLKRDAQPFSGDVNTLQTSGLYWTQNATNIPAADRWWLIIVIANTSPNNKRVEQIHIDDRSGTVYQRILSGTGWSAYRQLADMDAVGKAIIELKAAKSITVNGGTKITPDAAGNLAITTPDPDLSPYLTIVAAQKYRTADQVSAQIDTALAGYIKPITRTAYDKLSTADKQNGIWAIDEKG